MNRCERNQHVNTYLVKHEAQSSCYRRDTGPAHIYISTIGSWKLTAGIAERDDGVSINSWNKSKRKEAKGLKKIGMGTLTLLNTRHDLPVNRLRLEEWRSRRMVSLATRGEPLAVHRVCPLDVMFDRRSTRLKILVNLKVGRGRRWVGEDAVLNRWLDFRWNETRSPVDEVNEMENENMEGMDVIYKETRVDAEGRSRSVSHSAASEVGLISVSLAKDWVRWVDDDACRVEELTRSQGHVMSTISQARFARRIWI